MREIAEIAATWKDTPYQNSGLTKGPKGGVDCLNFIGACLLELGVLREVPRVEYDRFFWKREPDLVERSVIEAIATVDRGFKVLLNIGQDPNPGDVLMLEVIPNLGYATHVAIFDGQQGPQTMIWHADWVRGKVERIPLPNKWKILFSYAIKKLNNG